MPVTLEGVAEARAGDPVYLYRPGRWELHAVQYIDPDERADSGKCIALDCFGPVTLELCERYDIKRFIVGGEPPVKHPRECVRCSQHIARKFLREMNRRRSA
ncbi:MAG: hypothetical protein AB7Q81_24535 [Gammaproteobacteria bacterium]